MLEISNPDLLVFLGGRQSADIINWLKKKTGPPTNSLTDVEGAKAFVAGDNPVVVVGFFKVKALSYVRLMMNIDNSLPFRICLLDVLICVHCIHYTLRKTYLNSYQFE